MRALRVIPFPFVQSAAERRVAWSRAQTLLQSRPQIARGPALQKLAKASSENSVDTGDSENSETGLRQTLLYADLKLSPAVILCFSISLGAAAALVVSQLVNLYFVPLFFGAGASIPFIWLEGRVQKRASAFAADYPTVLLATASSIKTGMTPYQALERATRLLATDSAVRVETEKLLANLRKGFSKERAVRDFAKSIRQPDLDLFRSAFLLVLESGGKFAPTLERLATVGKDRLSLIEHARVSTATMRMTANVLLALTPLIMGTVAFRTPDFKDLILHHPVANVMASMGVVLIAGSYAVLRKMSNFKP